jgi:tetratricopeptide (TPR) repeat protein
MGRYSEHDSIVRIMEGFGNRLTPYERAEVQSQRALSDGDRRGNLAALRRASELAPHSTATGNLALYLMYSFNRPREALELLQTFDSEGGLVRGQSGYWQRLFSALMMLDEREQALDAALRAHRSVPEPGMQWLGRRALALAALGRVEDLHQVLDEIELAFDGNYRWLVQPVEVLRAYGHDEAVQEVLPRVIDWFEARPASEMGSVWHRHNYGRALYLAGRLDDAQDVYDALVEETPDFLARRATRALIAASRGDTGQALRDLEWFEALEPDEGQVGPALYFRGLAKAALGDRERAMQLIRESYDQTREYDLYDWMRRVSINVDPLRDYPPYQEFMRPKG